MKGQFRNEFHRTSSSLIVLSSVTRQEGFFGSNVLVQGHLSAWQVEKIENQLCGVTDCQCKKIDKFNTSFCDIQYLPCGGVVVSLWELHPWHSR